MPAQGDIITLEADRYRLDTALAESSYGVVWQAASLSGAPEVALKLINQDQMARAEPTLRTRWIASAQTEIAFLRALASWDRHIVRLVDSGTHQDLPVMALELMGPDLARHARAGTDLSTALDWLAQINQALATVHQYGWLYLDLKPANVLTERHGGGIKLADFGTSRTRADPAPGHFSGTASWQAPEQFFPSQHHTYDTDARSDYFALGAMFYYLATGGRQLRFCSLCGAAWRDHQAQAPARLLAAHGGIPATLTEAEADLVAHRVGAPALALLRALVAPQRSARPRHAIEISRMIDAIRPRPDARRSVHVARCWSAA